MKLFIANQGEPEEPWSLEVTSVEASCFRMKGATAHVLGSKVVTEPRAKRDGQIYEVKIQFDRQIVSGCRMAVPAVLHGQRSGRSEKVLLDIEIPGNTLIQTRAAEVGLQANGFQLIMPIANGSSHDLVYEIDAVPRTYLQRVGEGTCRPDGARCIGQLNPLESRQLLVEVAPNSELGTGYFGKVMVRTLVGDEQIVVELPPHGIIPAALRQCDIDAAVLGYENCDGIEGGIIGSTTVVPLTRPLASGKVVTTTGNSGQIDGGWVVSFADAKTRRRWSSPVDAMTSNNRIVGMLLHFEHIQRAVLMLRNDGEVFFLTDNISARGWVTPGGMVGTYVAGGRRSKSGAPSVHAGTWDLTRICPRGAGWELCANSAPATWSCSPESNRCTHN